MFLAVFRCRQRSPGETERTADGPKKKRKITIELAGGTSEAEYARVANLLWVVLPEGDVTVIVDSHAAVAKANEFGMSGMIRVDGYHSEPHDRGDSSGDLT